MQPLTIDLEVDRGTDQLAVRFYESPDAETVAVVFPAMGVPASYYDRLATTLVEARVAVAIADLRGTGASRPKAGRASRYGYHELADDVAAVLEALAPQREGRRTVLLGHSLGGQACVMHLARSCKGVDGLILIAVGLPYWRVYGKQKVGVFAYTQSIAALTWMLRYWPGWSFGGRQAHGVIRDWGHTGRHGVFPPHLGVEEKLSEITVPVLAISVDDDQYTPPPATDHLVTKLSSAVVQRKHLSRAEVDVALDHFKWVKAGSPLATKITDWLATF